MNSHRRRFTWTFATQNPKDPRETKYNTENAAELNSGAALAIVDKQSSSTVIDNLRDWEKDAIYEIARPHRSNRGFALSGLELSSPEKHIVGKPSAEEQLAAINHGKLIGSLAGGKIVKIHQAENFTGAIPVMDSEVRGVMFYYIPAQFERLAMKRMYFETKPSFIVLKDGEMPSYVFWKRKAEFPPSYSESDLMEQHRAIRSGAPTPEARSDPVAAPSSKARPAPPTVDIAKAAEVEEKQAQPAWEVFDPRLEEDPIEFLDFYNTCLNGRKGIRNKLMLREADIDRVNYISPCLAHNHKEIFEESEAATAEAEETAMDVDPVPSVTPSKVAGVPTPKSISPLASNSWVQPGPIPDDDPWWQRLLARQDKERQIRNARIRPKPIFTSEFCNAPGTTSDLKKAVLRRELYDQYYHRAVTANREIESRSKCCLACGLKWTQCTTTRRAHYKQHRDELKLYRQHCQNENVLLEDPLRVESLDPAKAPMINNVPAMNWFRDLDQIILNTENELLEREHTCRVCDAHVDFADESMADHYEKHAVERKQLRTIEEIANSDPTTPTVVVTPDGASVIIGSAKSSPAQTYQGFSTTPEYIRRIEEKQPEAQTQKALEKSAKVADIMVNVAEQIRETGTLPAHMSPPISLSSGSKPSESVLAALDDVMDTTEDGPIHSDVVGNTTAQRVFPPLMTLTSQSPVTTKVPASNPTNPELDDYLRQLKIYCEVTKVPRRAALDAYGMVRRCFESGNFTDMTPELLSVVCVWIGCHNDGITPGFTELAKTCNYSAEEIMDALDRMPSCFDALEPSARPSLRQSRDVQPEVIVIEDDETDSYASLVPSPSDPIEEPSADNDQAEIVQAIRSTSGELLALDDAVINDSKEAEEAPEEFEPSVENDVEEVPKEFGRIEIDDAEHLVQRHDRSQLRKEKRWRRAERQRLRQQEPHGEQWATQVIPLVSSAKWSTEAQASTTPRTPSSSPWAPGVPSSTSKPSGSNESSKRKRPAPLPTPVSSRKRKTSDESFQPGPPTPFDPDEISPRMPKRPRKSSDPSYRPGSALLDPTTPPVTPQPPKRKPNREADGRFAKKEDKKSKVRKAEKKKGKKVTFDAALTSKPSTIAPLLSPQVMITKKPSSSIPNQKTSKTAASKSSKSGVKKNTTKAKKTGSVRATTRPKRQAAIEAEKSFGKTKIVG
ncbi:hypothetical protein QM012_001578 [Aureobasidium pullulans]|uniref:C2H2-type domain-containing protein n=1 Tax=Aureobasidium pullulans TaxID=5580 RepID=A0ABR0TEI1_AURPU